MKTTSGSSPGGSAVGKIGSNESCKELLQQVDIIGSYMTKVFVSKDFKVLCSVDNTGVAYILEQVSTNHF